MKRIKLILWGFLLGLSLFWAIAQYQLPNPLSQLDLFRLLVQYSGTLAIGVMSAAMVLAMRSQRIEQRMDGLDKAYRLHKWLGIGTLVTAFSHWILMRIAESKGHDEALIGQSVWPVAQEAMGPIQIVLHGLQGAAGPLGNFAFYPAIILIAVALIKRVPYKFFASTHRLLALLYLFAAVHAVSLMEFRSWVQPVGIVTGLLITAGVVSALLSLSRQIGRGNRASGVIDLVEPFLDVRVVSSHIKMDERWEGHQAGQFAFVTFDRKEGKHPFTIASAWDPSTRAVMFVTRGLGDYTDLLPERLEVGKEVLVEGPYGCFTFDDDKPRQIWVAGGIGITPFIARMKQRALTPEDRPVDLFCAVPVRQKEIETRLTADAKAANVTLHFFVADEGKRLSGAELRSLVPDWQASSVWFCGPAAFGEAIKSDLVVHGLAPQDFHRELFDML